ncbi:MAG: polyisoprenoid-binding protein YceI [Kiritimatiellia bacterium]|jgi:polyisoprenoid-binding protein YceI
MIRWTWAGMLAAMLCTSAAQAAPSTYQLGGGTLRVVMKYDRNAFIASHDHVLGSTQYTGTATWDADAVQTCDVNVSMPLSTLVIDPAGTREQYDLHGETSESDKPKILKNALGKSQLNAAANPAITFQSASCTAQGDKVKVDGNFSMAGVTKPITIIMKTSADGSTFRATGSFKARHTQFGFHPFTAALGALRNDDVLTFHLDIRGKAN